MYFDFRTFARLKIQEAHLRAGWPAWLLTAAQALVYPVVHACFALDGLVYRGVSTVEVRRPIFIVGFPRSGTTLLFHLLARDPAVATLNLYRMIVPSVTLQRLVPSRVKAWFTRGLESWFTNLDPIHPIRAEQPEEDEILFLLLGNSGINSYFFPYGQLGRDCKVNRFWDWSEARRDRYLSFYHRTIQRLLWDTGSTRFVGKSPHFLGKIDDLHRRFPDACFIYLRRSPAECVPSTLSMITTMWRIAHPHPFPSGAIETIYEDLIQLWTHGDERVRALPEKNRIIVPYDQLVASPKTVVEDIYRRIGMTLPETLDAALKCADRYQRTWKSPHRYALGDYGLDRTRVNRDLASLSAETRMRSMV